MPWLVIYIQRPGALLETLWCNVEPQMETFAFLFVCRLTCETVSWKAAGRFVLFFCFFLPYREQCQLDSPCSHARLTCPLAVAQCSVLKRDSAISPFHLNLGKSKMNKRTPPKRLPPSRLKYLSYSELNCWAKLLQNRDGSQSFAVVLHKFLRFGWPRTHPAEEMRQTHTRRHTQTCTHRRTNGRTVKWAQKFFCQGSSDS